MQTDRNTYRENYVKRHREKMATHKPRKETWNRVSLAALQGTNPANNLI